RASLAPACPRCTRSSTRRSRSRARSTSRSRGTWGGTSWNQNQPNPLAIRVEDFHLQVSAPGRAHKKEAPFRGPLSPAARRLLLEHEEDATPPDDSLPAVRRDVLRRGAVRDGAGPRDR